MENTVKITKAMVLEATKAIMEDNFEVEVDGVTVTSADIVAYCDTTLEQLAAKNAKAAERAAAKRAEGDALREVVASVLTGELQTRDEVTAAVNAIEGYEDITPAKVGARLTQLVTAEVAEKETVKVEKNSKMAYRLK